MSMDIMRLYLASSLYLTITLTIFRNLICRLIDLISYPIFIKFVDSILSVYFRLFCDLTPCAVDLDDRTTMHFWTPAHRRIGTPNLVMIHGYGGDAKWQFVWQVGPLSRHFNLYVPDLLFFGHSYTRGTERTDSFQAKCVVEGLKSLGVHRFTIYAISYGGFVGHRAAENYPDAVEKIVIVSSGVGLTAEQKSELLKNHNRAVTEILVPRSPHDLRTLVRVSMRDDRAALAWAPDVFLSQFIRAMYSDHRKELVELVNNVLEDEGKNPPAITQETLIVWGDRDRVFPLEIAQQLHRKLPNSRLEIIKNAGHAVNVEAPKALNNLIISFTMGCL